MAIAERSAPSENRWEIADKRSAGATQEESMHLGVSVGCPVVRVVRVRQSQGRNDLVESTVMLEGSAASMAGSMFAEERLSIVPAPAWVAEILNVPVASPLLKLDCIVRTPSGVPLEWRLTFSPSASASGIRRKPGAQDR